MTVGLAATAAVVGPIPARARHAGVRRARFPWRAFALVWVAAVPATVIIGIVFDLPGSAIFRLSVLCSGAYAACSYWARQKKQSVPLKELLQQDARAPVFYLRSFDREDETFAMPTNEECSTLEIPIRNPSAWRQPATVEQYLAKEVSRRLGPFVALGDPRDYLPPEGALREYVDDSKWHGEFRRIAHASSFILMTLGNSENLHWELGFIRSEHLERKLFVLTRPAYPRRWYSYASWNSRRGRQQWPAFQSQLDACGYVAGEYPGEGAIIGFDDGGKSTQHRAGVIHAKPPRADPGRWR